MRPILLCGHERAITQVKCVFETILPVPSSAIAAICWLIIHGRFSKEGDLIFSVSKDHVACAWFSDNGERFGTYEGHVGALWSVDVNPSTTLLATGSGDRTLRLWNVKTGELLKTWEYSTSIKRVEFSEDGTQLLGVTEKRIGHLSNIYVYDIIQDVKAEQSNEPALQIVVEDLPRVTAAGFSFSTRFIVTGHDDGTVTQWNAKTGEMLCNVQSHEDGMRITDIQWSTDRTYFVTSSRDKTARLHDSKTMEVMKTYVADLPLNSAAIMPDPVRFVILGGGQAAMDVAGTYHRQRPFEARFYDKIFEEEVGRIKGHFGPINCIAVDPTGKSYCSGSEDGYVRLHQFDSGYLEYLQS